MERHRPTEPELADQLAAFGLAIRREILRRLVDGPQPVSRIAGSFPVSRAAISQHIRVLKRTGLVVDCAVRNRRCYALNVDALEALRQYFKGLWHEATERVEKTESIAVAHATSPSIYAKQQTSRRQK
jgi:DNA-binding transcriptional ArsR family regulator